MRTNPTADRNRVKILQWLGARSELFARQGSVVASWRHVAGRKLGPYFLVMYRLGGKQHGRYLGRCPAFAAEVRHVLDRLQAPLREKRESQRQERQLRQGLRHHKQEWDAELRKVGLFLKGFEVRGYRQPRPPQVLQPAQNSQQVREESGKTRFC